MSERPVRQEAEAREEFLSAASDLWPVAKGSLSRVARPCGRPGRCAACRSGRRHPMWIFTFRKGGRLRCRYVPNDLVEPLRLAVANARRLETRLAEEGEALIERYRRARASERGA